jgi:hypothetical protein
MFLKAEANSVSCWSEHTQFPLLWFTEQRSAHLLEIDQMHRIADAKNLHHKHQLFVQLAPQTILFFRHFHL